MRVYWERIGVLDPIYRLVGKGLNDPEIANKLNITEIKVQGCISWMLHSFKMPNRMELARDAFSTEHSTQPAHLKGG
jgi:DNA-binding NarL/FixJ family response regulator